MVIGTAGSVSTGAVDPIRELAGICREHGLWFHVDGAYGAPAAVLPDAPDDLHALGLADSLAVDPHKWLYAPLEAGCSLVREPHRLNEAFGYTPAYYHFDIEGEEPPINYYELGLQNSRGFRALKIWLGAPAGRTRGLRPDDRRRLPPGRGALPPRSRAPRARGGHARAQHRDLPLRAPRPARRRGRPSRTSTPSTRRCWPGSRPAGRSSSPTPSSTERFLLRACIVNFRTTDADVAAIPAIVAGVGRVVDAELRPGRHD